MKENSHWWLGSVEFRFDGKRTQSSRIKCPFAASVEQKYCNDFWRISAKFVDRPNTWKYIIFGSSLTSTEKGGKRYRIGQKS